MTAADTFAGVVFVLTAAVSAVLIRRALRRRYEADPWRQIDTEALQDIRARRDPQLAAVVGSRATLLAATYDGSEAPPRVIRRAEPVDVGLDRETTVRIPPEDVHVGPPINHPIGHPIAWPEPIPQAIVNHVALWQTTAGRHRLTDGAR